jgi:glycosyltransferase involved in cell wall biosynthesis
MSSKTALLLLEPFTAHPCNSGGRTRIYQTIDQLRHYFQLSVWQFVADQEEAASESYWLKDIGLPFQHFAIRSKRFFSFLRSGLPYWFSDWWNPKLIATLSKQATQFPLIQVEFSQLLYLVKYLPAQSKKVFVAHDIASLSFWRRLQSEKNLLKKCLHFCRWLEVLLYERRYLPRFDLVIAMSEPDKAFLQKHFGLTQVTVIENGIAGLRFLPLRQFKQPLTLGLIGSFAHPPNQEAFRFTCQEILPELERRGLNFRFYLAGDNSQDDVQPILARSPLQNKTLVKNLGFVASPSDFYRQVDILLAPLFAGSGTRIKILESLSFMRPVLTTVIGAEGLTIDSAFLQVVPEVHEKQAVIWVNAIEKLQQRTWSLAEKTKLAEQLKLLTWRAVMKKSVTVFGLTL